MPESPPDRYIQSFEKFLAHTEEKPIFIKEFAQYIERYRTKSVLDIGAGNGALAAPISQEVDEYEAIEQNPKYAYRLREAGVPVIEASFPVTLSRTYDLVLMSHLISYEVPNHKALIPPAW